MVEEYRPSSFIQKFHSILTNKNLEGIIKYDEPNSKIFIFDKEKLEIQILPFYFRHNKFTSLIRQLNHYGFKKIRSDPVLTFTHATLLKGKKFLEIIAKKKAELMGPENENRNINLQGQHHTPQLSDYNDFRPHSELQNNNHRFFVGATPSQQNVSYFMPQNIPNLNGFNFLVPAQENSQVITYLFPFPQSYQANGFAGYFQSL